jgi:hypothetical protein
MQYIPHFEWQSKEAFGEWLNTAPKEEVMPYLKRALANAKSMRNAEAVSKIQAVINQVEEE